ncbi:MAG: hypothetical protein ABI415_11665 [Flavitalea sp.]
MHQEYSEKKQDNKFYQLFRRTKGCSATLNIISVKEIITNSALAIHSGEMWELNLE